MLTKQEALSEIVGDRVVPDKLIKARDAHYIGLAGETLAVYRDGIGETRESLHSSVDQIFFGEENCPPRRVQAFCKLLDDEAEFDGAEGDDAARLRIRVFQLAAAKHPLVVEPQTLLEHREAHVKSEIAQTLGESWSQIERRLFSDVFALHRLKAFRGYNSAEALLTRYNEAQLQAVLYDATQMRITATADYRPIITAIKLARLMYTAVRTENGFEFIVEGPAALLRETRRYGVLMARIIPTLLACRGWKLRARIKRFRHSNLQPELVVPSGHYHSSVQSPPEFDSELERGLMEKWGTGARDGWRLKRESEPRFVHQKAFFPDFAFEHDTGARVLFEIIGYWTPEYLKAKRETLHQFRDEPLLLAIRQNAAATFGDLRIPIVSFGSALNLGPILDALSTFRNCR